jgi:hypothetical protein
MERSSQTRSRVCLARQDHERPSLCPERRHPQWAAAAQSMTTAWHAATIRAPFFNMEFSLIKNVPLGEHRTLQLRLEAFNIFNFQILGMSGTTVGLASEGLASSTASTPRELQPRAKLAF